MAEISLKSILSPRKNITAHLQRLLAALGGGIGVEDERGRHLIGIAEADQTTRCPVTVEGQVFGWVSGTGPVEEVAGLLTNYVARETEKKKLGLEVLNLYREINLIYNFSEKVATAFSPSAIARIALSEAGQIIKFRSAAVVLWDDEKNTSGIIAQSGPLFFNEADLLDQHHFIQSLITNGQAKIIARQPELTGGQPFILMHAALKVKHRVMGAMVVEGARPDSFSAADLKLLTTLALQSASAIESLLLLEKTVWKTLELEREKMDAENVKKLSDLKSQFFTNIAHEFRTPLTVILGMTEQLKLEIGQLVSDAGLPAKSNLLLNNNLELIRRNGKNLVSLISQLLDLSKLEEGGFQLHLQQGDIIFFLHYLTESFQTYASNHQLTLHFSTSLNALLMDFDPEQLRQVVTNLLSNAIKFTPPGGRVRMQADLLGADFSESNLRLIVSDTGAGIPQKDLPQIFDRFYQAEGTSGGTGIGLAHARELVKLMGGNISVESEVGYGTVFTVELPVRKESTTGGPSSQPSDTFVPSSLRDGIEPVNDQQPDDQSSGDMKPLLLVIEDSPDIVSYLKSCLRSLYQVIVATNGQAGIEKALDVVPDLIISDVMMPLKDGFEVTDTLKNDERTSHIPIILLTARADVESRLEGLRRGADVYLAKPFEREELLVRIGKLLELRKHLKDRFRQVVYTSHPLHADHNPVQSPEISEPEDAFIRKIKGILAENIADENFSLPELCLKVNMSRSQLFRKMKALIDESPSGFIRSYRLHRAKDLLQTTSLSVSEIGYEVGFKDPAHFSKSFQEEFGMPPSASRG